MWTQTSKEVIKFNEIFRVGPSSDRISVIIRRDTRELMHSLCVFVRVPRTRLEGGRLQARKKDLTGKANLPQI